MSAPKKAAGNSSAPDDGRNEYIPKYIANSPWYAQDESSSSAADYLKHQRSTKKEVKTEWYKRGVKKTAAATKYRPGACTNCGAMTHKAQDCLERPRKVGAKYSGVDLKPDDDVREISTTWDSKRDRWNGFDADDYKEIMKNLEARAEAEAKAKENISQEDAQKDEDSLPVWSLRERDDQAEYVKSFKEDSEGAAAGESHAESHADKLRSKAAEFESLQQTLEKANERGLKLNLEANPTEAYLKLKQLKDEEERVSNEAKRKLLHKYGRGLEEQKLPPRPKEVPEKVADANSNANSYASRRLGPNGVALSKYPEDVYPGNHSSVWGSYWKSGKWGYKCCHSLLKASYCVGEIGIRLEKEQEAKAQELINDTAKDVVKRSNDEPENTGKHDSQDSQDSKTKKRKL